MISKFPFFGMALVTVLSVALLNSAASAETIGYVATGASVDQIPNPTALTYDGYLTQPGIQPWTWLPAEACNDYPLMDTQPNGDGGPARVSVDATTATDNMYGMTILASDLASADQNGWTLETTMRACVGRSSSYRFRVDFEDADNDLLWCMAFKNNNVNNGPMTVQVNSSNTYVYSVGNSNYHDYRLVYDPVTNTADFFVDGVEKISDCAPFSYAYTVNRIAWGDCTGASSTLRGFFRSVGWTAAVPEPSTLALLVLAGLTVCVRCRR